MQSYKTKKILIVNNNLDMGGIQKSLVNQLKEIHEKYDITLLLFSKSGSLLNDVPDGVNVITPQKVYRTLGLNKDELKKYPLLFLIKAFLLSYAKHFSRRKAMKLLGMFQKKIKGYDVAISYSHLFNDKYFANGCGDFVLDKIECDNKICLIHCDYLNSGCMTENNNSEYKEFDKIACCSDSVKERFLQGSKIAEEKVYTLRNFYDFDVIKMAKDNTYQYEEEFVNLVLVARLSKEKGIDRAINALYCSGRNDIRYYIIGNGPQKEEIENQIKENHLENRVFLLGEQKNPYRYMVNADYLLVPSLNEAAPMVFDEAKTLGLNIITTDTTSAVEMVGNDGGIVCKNSVEGIKDALLKVAKVALKDKAVVNNDIQQKQFLKIVNP